MCSLIRSEPPADCTIAPRPTGGKPSSQSYSGSGAASLGPRNTRPAGWGGAPSEPLVPANSELPLTRCCEFAGLAGRELRLVRAVKVLRRASAGRGGRMPYSEWCSARAAARLMAASAAG
jgi:hypothetical protein